MYVRSIRLREVRSVSRADIDFRHPGQPDASRFELPNINVLVGLNGGGKTTVLKAVAASFLAPIVGSDGLGSVGVHNWPRYDANRNAEASIELEFNALDGLTDSVRSGFIASVDGAVETSSFRAAGGGVFCAYGPDRGTDYGRGRDQSVFVSNGLSAASLLRPGAALRGIEDVRDDFDASWNRVVASVNRLTPPDLVLTEESPPHESVRFSHRDVSVPIEALSDGMQSYLAFLGDMLYTLLQTVDDGNPRSAHGIVLIDEIDQRMHPEWQQRALSQLSSEFELLQFICTAHSPLLANSLRPDNLILMASDLDADGDGATTANRVSEDVFGRNADQVLLSSYFNLDMSRGEPFRRQIRERSERLRRGDRSAAREAMELLTDHDTVGRGNIVEPQPPRRFSWRWLVETIRRFFGDGPPRGLGR